MTEPGRAYRALLIGNSEFPGDPDHLRPLLGPPTDIPLLSGALTDADTGLHQADAVRTVLEETTQRVKEELAEFLESALPHEQLFLYYSGHGLLDLRNRLRLCARDTTVAQLRARSVELGYIDDLIEDCAARSIVVVLDCCFSGAAAVKGTDPTAQLAGHGRFVMTSSSHGDVSADAEEAGAASPFTRHLVTGLRSGAPGRDGVVTAYDVYRYVHGRLRASGQIPHMKTEAGVGAIPLARRRKRSAESGTADGRVRAPGDDAVPLEVRPVFTDPDENQYLLATYTDFSGVLHVFLRRYHSVLTTHRDAISAAGESTPVAAELYTRADVTWSDVHARVKGRKVTDLRADTSGGAVSFVLPNGTGTVEWQESQVRAFRQAGSQGRWPGTPLTPSSAIDEYKTDRGYQRLRTAPWRFLLWLSAPVPAAAAQGGLTGLTWYEGIGRVVLGLAIIFFLFQALNRPWDIWRFLRIRSVLRNSGLYTIPMVMKTGMVEEVSSDGMGAIELKRPYAWLRYDGAPPAPPRQGEPDEIPPEEAEWPLWFLLGVPLHSFHSRDIHERSDSPNRPGIEYVEVIGTPRPGRWVVIRTADGMLWPRAKAE
ncbi:caspase domain-containing protein [Streptomyces sp. NPDC088551]|uniref:caspase family protein n=1 Tax=Streptomyces sp. NPDC088551 TaxID=3365863 RepID=UPI00381C6F0F